MIVLCTNGDQDCHYYADDAMVKLTRGPVVATDVVAGDYLYVGPFAMLVDSTRVE